MVAALFALTVGAWSGWIESEYRVFSETALAGPQHRSYLSLAAQPEFTWKSADGDDSFHFVGFARADQHDRERSHADVRELTWVHVREAFEARLGVRKIFWGVTEAQHLVDVINQTDFVEDIESEDKLGQPMVNIAWTGTQVTLEGFILPGFRTRTFPGREGRPRSEYVVATDSTEFGSPRARAHVDYAARASARVGAWDVGLAYFRGTNRDPNLLPALAPGGEVVLIPRYEQMEQTGLDVQATLGAWLWKLEAIYRAQANAAPYAASTVGFEYTFAGLWGGNDVGVIGEYLWDERRALAPTLFQDDVMLGLRIGFNDEQSSEALFGAIVDLDNDSRMYTAEASRRVGKQWRLGGKARVFSNAAPSDPIFSFRNDDYVELTWGYYF